MRHASDQIIKAVAYATAFQEKSRKISVGNHLQHFVGLLTRISQCGQPHPRICFAFPAKPLQPASDLLLQKKQILYAYSYRIRGQKGPSKTCLGVSPNSLVQWSAPACLWIENAPTPQKAEQNIKLIY